MKSKSFALIGRLMLLFALGASTILSIEGFQQTVLFRVSGIVFCEETIPTISVASAGTGQAIIGLDILSKFNFSLDFIKRQLHLYARKNRELKRASR